MSKVMFKVTVKNLISSSDFVYRFTHLKECDDFIKDMRLDVYASPNLHIREVSNKDHKNIISEYVIFTSMKDKEYVTVERIKA